MKLYFVSLLLLLAGKASSQTVNGIPFDEIESQWIQIEGLQRGLTSKMKVKIDFGQPRKLLFADNKRVIKDKEGKIKEFNSMVDALNFMSDNGYEFVNAYAVSQSDDMSYFYLLKRKNSAVREESTNQ